VAVAVVLVGQLRRIMLGVDAAEVRGEDGVEGGIIVGLRLRGLSGPIRSMSMSD